MRRMDLIREQLPTTYRKTTYEGAGCKIGAAAKSCIKGAGAGAGAPMLMPANRLLGMALDGAGADMAVGALLNRERDDKSLLTASIRISTHLDCPVDAI
jgi:hypothetical protein